MRLVEEEEGDPLRGGLEDLVIWEHCLHYLQVNNTEIFSNQDLVMWDRSLH